MQILWIKLIESPLPATSLSFEDAEVDVMKDIPRKRSEQFLSKQLKINIAFYALVMDTIALSIFYFYWKFGGGEDKARTIMFVALGMSTLFMVYSVRSLRKSVFQINPFKNKFLVFATVVGFGLFLVAVYSKTMNEILKTVSLSVEDWLVIFAYAIVALCVFEAGKVFSKKF